jgi:choline-sulfatase
MSRRPNILLIMSDEHDPAVTGCYGDRLVRTPNLDALAARGVTFDACYTPSPLCVPARSSVTVGKRVSRISAWQNDSELPSDTMPSLPRLLRAAGYSPYLCGKQHYDARRRYGFIDLCPEFNRQRKRGSGERRDPRDREPVLKMWRDREGEFRPGEDSFILRHDRQVTSMASRFLRDHDRAQGPFLLFAGYLAPHFPLIVPDALYQRYRGRTPAPIPARPFARQPLNIQHQQLGFGTTVATAEEIQRGRDLYWAFVDWFDAQVGELLGALARSSAADDTIVVYTSDHGENKGDHGLWWKNCLYEHAARVPVIVCWPARWAGGQRRSGACSLLDLVRTVVDVAGGTCPADWDGDSMLGWLDDPAQPWKNRALSEYYGHNVCSGSTMYRVDRWKYIHHARIDAEHGPERELYDLAADPT